MTSIVVLVGGLVLFLMLAFLGMPIAVSFMTAGVAGVIAVKGLGPGLALLGTAPWQWACSVDLICVPLFILMGQFAFHAGITNGLYEAAYRWVGRLPGGLALSTCLACTGFAACTGNSIASAATMSTIAYPEMERFHYDRRLAVGVIGAGGTLGILIPPSVIFIVYGFIIRESISELFIAGILPGIMLSGMFLVTTFIWCLKNPKLGPRGESFSWDEKISALSKIWFSVVLFVLVVGGIYFGVFAPSEAGAAGAFGAFVIGLLLRRLTVKKTATALRESLGLSCMTYSILIGAMIFNVFVTVTGVPAMLAEWVTGLSLSPYVILILIIVMYIPMGMVLDAMSMVLLTVPIVTPIISGLGFDLIWFGVVLVVLVEMALLTPPVGMVVYVVHGITKVPLDEVFRGNMPFVLCMLVAIGFLILIPEIALYLPHLMR
jgi:C4-dicarboxylate transporter, DctM subunit